MTRVDFYILPDDDEQRRQDFLCRLVDKAWRLGNRIWIHAPDEDRARALDERLWTFSQGSFVPHECAGEDGERSCPVLIGGAPATDDVRSLLVNEASGIPGFHDRFERIAEVVNQAPGNRSAGRTRYTHYRDQGFELHHHRVT